MPTAVCDGIETRYELIGNGRPLLLFSPGGFNATIENWSTFGIYERLHLLEHLSERFTCIAFDKRESGVSGGRFERLTWEAYAAQGLALLDELRIERAHVMGGCIGCSIALALAVLDPDRLDRLVLYSPAGGPRYRITQRTRFAEHAAYVEEHGLDGAVELARSHEKTFAQDPRIGPFVTLLRAGGLDVDEETYLRIVDESARTLFSRDTVPGPDAEDLMQLEVATLVVPGNDANHALSAAHYLAECLPRAELWNVLPAEQTAENAPQRVLQFLQSSDSPRSSAAI